MINPEKSSILIVEDSQITAGDLTKMIRSSIQGAVVAIVRNARDAIAAIERMRPDLLILDLKLRESSGFSVLRALQTLPHRPIVLVYTNYALPKYRDYSFLMGADYFLDKADSIALPQVLDKIAHRLAEPRARL